ncbi:MAG: porin family protein [Marinobacter sp.]|uniref:porin family protein n=1 Tax=Marinobacter sp. TaxID=50741 RepID=UPI00299CD581|nr:porin family protein [Marinobacter sp.]MDX1633923.1 porin family protein [Marinobacter sp.]
MTTALLVAQGAPAQETAAPAEPAREDLYYVGLIGSLVQLRSLESAITDDQDEITDVVADSADLNTASLIIGGHISELFHAEIRLGGGLSEAKVRNDLTISLDYFASWFFGIHYPLTDFAHGYAQFGFTHLQGEAELTNPDANRNSRYDDLAGDFPDSSFSASWLIGLDLELFDNAYLVLEGGKLFEDTVTDVTGYQFSSGLRYEF